MKHLRNQSRATERLDLVDALTKLPNKLRYQAIDQTLDYEHNTIKSDGPTHTRQELHLHLLQLCQPPTNQTTHQTSSVATLLTGLLTGLFAPVTKPIHARRDREAREIASQARRRVLLEWNHLAPEARKLALTIDADWASHVRPLLAQDSDAIKAISAFYLDAEPALGLDLRTDPHALRLMLTAGDRAAADLAERTILPQILAAAATPNAERPRALRERGPARGQPTTDIPRAPLAHAVRATMHAIDAYADHQRSIIALAALLLCDRPANDPHARDLAPLHKAMRDPEHPAFQALRRALKRDPSPAVRRIAWSALLPGPLAMAALERLNTPATPAEHAVVLERAYLLLNPARRHLLAQPARSKRAAVRAKHAPLRAAELAPLLPSHDTPLGIAAQRGLTRLIPHADTNARNAIHDRVLTSDDPHTRLIAARHADATHLADLCFDAHPAVATLAALRRSPVGVVGPSHAPEPEHRQRMNTLLVRSPHAQVRRIAAEDTAQSALLTADGMPSLRAIALAQRDRATLASELAAHLDTDDTETRVRTIRAACRLGVASALRHTLEAMLAEQDNIDARVAATAAAALGTVAEAAVLPAIAAALRHTDPRVRANSVESIERVFDRVGPGPETELIDQLTEIKRTPEHRVRANAIRALERLRLADEDQTDADLAEMLTDLRPAHRLAGVWLAERLLCDPRRAVGPGDLAWQTAARRVAGLARGEGNAHIRARATRCTRRLLGEIARPTRTVATDPAIAETTRRVRALANVENARPSSQRAPQQATDQTGARA